MCISRRVLFLGLVAIVAWGGAAPGFAQTRSSITGTVTDSSKLLLPGVTLTLSSPDMVGGPQVAVSGADGSYRFWELPAGTYLIAASLQGFQTVKRTDLRVENNARLTIDLELSPSGVAEEVTVKAVSPTIETRTAAANLRIDADFIQSNPPDGNIPRSGYDILLNAPGVATTRTAFGSTGVNNLQIDGVSSASAQIGNVAGSTLAPDWMQEVLVVGLGAPAEYGETAGLVSNMIIRSGSNRFSGLFSATSVIPEWQGDNTMAGCPDACLLPPAQQGQKGTQILGTMIYTAQVGGPVLQNKLFFFGGYNYYRNKVIQPFALSTTPQLETFPRGILKVSWAAKPSVRVEGYLEHDVSTNSNAGGSATTKPESMFDSYNPKTTYNLRATWTPTSKTVIDVRNGGNNFIQQLWPLSHTCAEGPLAHRDSSGMNSVNSVSGCNVQKSNRNITIATATQYAEHLLGISHEFKAGVEFERSWYQTENRLAGGGSYFDLNGAPNQKTLFEGSITEGTTKRFTAYLQDNWVLNKHITLQPGVRYTRDRGSVPDIPNVFRTDYVDARLGVAWDIASDHKTIVRAHYGRYRDAAYTILYDYMDFSRQSPTYVYTYSAATQIWNLTSTSIPGNSRLTPGDLTHAYLDQYLIGVDREIFTDISLSMNYIHRSYEHIFAFDELNRTWTEYPTGVLDPGPDGKLGTADDGALVFGYVRDGATAASQLITPSDATRSFDGIQFIARKRFSNNWQAQVAYTYSKTFGRVSNISTNGYALGPDTGTSGQWVNPNTRINAVGRGQNDKPHVFQASGMYRLPWFGGFNASGNYRLESGAAWGRTAALVFPSPTSTQTIRMETRGTRRMGTQHILSARVEKTFTVKRYTTGVFMDIFNLLNTGAATAVNEASGASFGFVTALTAPRRLQWGVRVTF